MARLWNRGKKTNSSNLTKRIDPRFKLLRKGLKPLTKEETEMKKRTMRRMGGVPSKLMSEYRGERMLISDAEKMMEGIQGALEDKTLRPEERERLERRLYNVEQEWHRALKRAYEIENSVDEETKEILNKEAKRIIKEREKLYEK